MDTIQYENTAAEYFESDMNISQYANTTDDYFEHDQYPDQTEENSLGMIQCLNEARERYDQVKSYLQEHFGDRYYTRGHQFEDFEQAYLHGVAAHGRYGHRMWDPDIQSLIRQEWKRDPASQDLPWDIAHLVIVDGWHAIECSTGGAIA